VKHTLILCALAALAGFGIASIEPCVPGYQRACGDGSGDGRGGVQTCNWRGWYFNPCHAFEAPHR
jgi:hypothetical protein